jgi:hypothetical protein
MRKFTLSLCMFFACGVIQAQTSIQLSPNVISSSGGFFENSAGKLSYTVGEMTMVQTFTGTNNILTQGFQQAFDYGVAVQEPTKDNVTFGIYPNPSSGHVYIVLNAKTNTIVDLRLIDAVGKTVASDHFNHSAGVNSYSYNWNNLSNGMYMIEVTSTDPLTNRSQKSMKKINIIY